MGYVGIASALTSAIAPVIALTLLQGPGAVSMIAVACTSTVTGIVIAIFYKPPQTGAGERSPEKPARIRISDMFDKRAFLPASVAFLVTMGYASVNTFIALHGQARGVDGISLYFVVYAIVMIITRPPIGKLIDKVGFFVPGILAMIGIAVGLVLISFASDTLAFCVAGVFSGLGIGTAMSTFQTMAVSAVPSPRRGVATSTYLFGFDAGISAGALVAGFFAGHIGYGGMFMSMAAFPSIGVIIFLIIGNKRIARYSG
jgi:MFS family permease